MVLLLSRTDGPTNNSAIVKIILFTVTGAIVSMIVTLAILGTIRAYRHPERYELHAVAGQPRRSRARGIAHAILDTIPIVRFNEEKPESSAGVELESNPVKLEQGNTSQDPKTSENSVIEVPDTVGFSHPSPTDTWKRPSDDRAADDEKRLRCSICTEDFNTGEEVRVLPCNHKFHTGCVDPWLLNVSSTCPMCRIDLDPESQQTSSSTQVGNAG